MRKLLPIVVLLAVPASAQESRPTSRPAKVPEHLKQRGAEPPGFKRLLPKGRIAAIRKPRYVPAREARIRPEAWVLGVVIGGEARAYSLNLLNRHEIVNDAVGKTAFAAVW